MGARFAEGLALIIEFLGAEFIPYNYTTPLVIFACFGIAAFFLALYLKVIDKKNGYGLEEANIKN